MSVPCKNFNLFFNTDGAAFQEASKTIRQLGLNRMIRVVRCKLFVTVDDRMRIEDCQSSFNVYVDILNYKCKMLNLNLTKPVDTVDLELILYQENTASTTTAAEDLVIPSRSSGLNLFFNIDTSYYLDKVNVLLGQNTQMDFSMTYTEQLSAPYGSCLEQPQQGSMWSALDHKLRYSKMGCRFSARQKLSFQHCGCVKTGFSLKDLKEKVFDNVTSCIDDYDLFNCSENVLSPANVDVKHCQDLCKQAMFHKHVVITPLLKMEETVSFYRSYIRNKSFEYRFATVLKGKDYTKMNDVERKYVYDLIMKNFASININFNLKEIVVYKEVPQYTFSSFIGQLGGILNLYSGISFVVIIELLDFFCSFFRSFFNTEKPTDKFMP